MVLFDNIHVGQIVYVFIDGRRHVAKVRYAGSLFQKSGDWVGLELRLPIGNTDGLYRGQRYFYVRENYGIFTTADFIRFVPPKRHLYDIYHCVNKESVVDVDLQSEVVADAKPGLTPQQKRLSAERQTSCLPESYVKAVANLGPDRDMPTAPPRFHSSRKCTNETPAHKTGFLREPRFPLRHAISSCKPPSINENYSTYATMRHVNIRPHISSRRSPSPIMQSRWDDVDVLCERIREVCGTPDAVGGELDPYHMQPYYPHNYLQEDSFLSKGRLGKSVSWNDGISADVSSPCECSSCGDCVSCWDNSVQCCCCSQSPAY